MNEKREKTGSLLIITAGIFWATMGVFVRRLGEYGFDSIQTAAFRLSVAAICFALILLVRGGKELRIRLKDLPLFLGLGIGSVAAMTCLYFTAIRLLTMSTAAILLYTSPIWVMLMSILFFRETVTKRKLAALILAFGGCMLVSGIGAGEINPAGLAAGIASGVAYGLYSILGAIALRRYSPYTVTAYTFCFAAIGVIAISQPAEICRKLSAETNLPGLVLLIAATGIVTAVIPFLLYTIGLNAVEPSRAAILATTEPMAATVIGMIAFGEGISLSCALGILCILAAIITLNYRRKSK